MSTASLVENLASLTSNPEFSPAWVRSPGGTLVVWRKIIKYVNKQCNYAFELHKIYIKCSFKEDKGFVNSFQNII